MMMAARKGRAAARPDAAQDRRAAHESAYWHLTDVGILANVRFAPKAVLRAILCRLVTALPMSKRSTILLGPSFYGNVSITNELAQAFPFTHHVGTKFGRRHRPWHVTDRFHALGEIGRVHYACD